MCWVCGCGELEDDHGNASLITTSTMEAAARAAQVDVPHVVSNIVLSLAHFDPSVAKGIDTPYAAFRVVKSTGTKRFTLGVAYPAMKADKGIASDGYRDFVSAEVLERTAWDWLAKSREVNLFHQDRTEGHFTPTESYIWRADPWKIVSPVDGKEYVVKAGTWMLGGIWDAYGWNLIGERLVNGWSPEGGAHRVVPSPERLTQVEV